MSKSDKAKEQIAYLKFWLGVMVVTDISLVGWFISSADSAPVHKVIGAIVAVVVITVTGFIVHRRVKRLIDALEELWAWKFSLP
jgi:hypothetical protein